jgi:uncharacterized protein YceK
MAKYVLAVLLLFVLGGCASIIEDFTKVPQVAAGTDGIDTTEQDAGDTDPADTSSDQSR